MRDGNTIPLPATMDRSRKDADKNLSSVSAFDVLPVQCI